MSLDLDYRCLRSHIEQDLLFGNEPAMNSIKDRADNAQTVHSLPNNRIAAWEATPTGAATCSMARSKPA